MWDQEEPEMEPNGEFKQEPGDEIIRRQGPLDELPPTSSLQAGLWFFALCAVASLNGWAKTEIGDQLWVSQAAVYEHHQYWRIFTALFVHADLVHLLSNAPMLIIFGFYLRAFFGPWVFPVCSMLIGGIANALTILAYEPDQRLVGASGMIYGMAGLWLTFYLRFDIRYTVPQRLVRVCGFVLMVLMPTTFIQEVSYLAHFLGFLVGIIFALILCPMFHLLPSKETSGE